LKVLKFPLSPTVATPMCATFVRRCRCLCSVLIASRLRGAHPWSDPRLERGASDDPRASAQAPARETDTGTHNIQSAQRLRRRRNPGRHVSDWRQHHGH